MGIINEIRIAPAATEVDTTELESRLQILTNEVHTNYINTDGSIGMQSNLDMDENKITNISTDYPPSDQAQAVSWSQVLKFVTIATKDLFRKVGGKITGDVNMDGNKILNLSTDYPPSDRAQAVSWSQVLKFVTIATKDLFRKVGGKITGDVNMDGNKILNLSTDYPPSDRAQAVSWSQVLKFVTIATKDLFRKVGGKITGDVNMDGNKILNLPTDYPPSDRAQAVSWSQIAQVLRRSTTNLANKTGETFSGNINMDNNKIINIPDPVNDGDVVNKRTIINLANKTGETVSGDINMNNNKIINIPDPVEDGDVVNKKL